MIDLRLRFARWPFSTVLSEAFGQQVSHRDAKINLSTFPTSGFVWAVSAGILAVLSPLLDPPKTCHVPVCFPLCLSRLRGVGCRYFWRHWCMLCPDPLSVWFALVGGLARTSWSQWVCPWWFPAWHALPRSALCLALADLYVPMLWDLITALSTCTPGDQADRFSPTVSFF